MILTGRYKTNKQLTTERGLSQELPDKRTSHSKVYKLPDGNFHLIQALTPLHYKGASGEWLDTDLTFSADLSVTSAPYDVTVLPGKIGYEYRSKLGGLITVELVSLGGDSSFVVPKPTVASNNVYWGSVVHGLNMQLVAQPSGVEIFKQINNTAGLMEMVWRVEVSQGSSASFNEQTLGSDADGNSLEIATKKTLLPSVGTELFLWHENPTGRVSKVVDVTTRKKQWVSVPRFPLIVDASVSESVVTSTDDAWDGGSYGGFYTNGYVKVGTIGVPQTTKYHGGWRFQTIAIPNAATITSATLNAEHHSFSTTGTNTMNIDIYGDDVDSAVTWSSGSKPSGITKTTAKGSYYFNNNTDNTAIAFDLTTVVQEIVNRAGWSTGNDMRFATANELGVSQQVRANVESYDAGTTPTLDVIYASSTDYPLTATQQSYTLTGEAATVTSQRTLTTVQASFSLTGIAALFTQGYGLVATYASFTLTGVAATITSVRTMVAAQASFVLTGIAATVSSQFKIVATQASYALTGIAASLSAARGIVATYASFTLTGYAAALSATIARTERAILTVKETPKAFLKAVSQSTTLSVDRTPTASTRVKQTDKKLEVDITPKPHINIWR